MRIVGYGYQAENLCPGCTLKALRANGITVQRGRRHEDAIRRAAQNLGINFDDEHSYDQNAFPKAVTEQQCLTVLAEVSPGEPGTWHGISDERCAGVGCGKWLVLGEKSPSEARLARIIRDGYELPHDLAELAAGTLREWGLSHPAFIDEDSAREAVAQHPHAWLGYRFVNYPTSAETEAISTPEHDGDACVHCGRPWTVHQAQAA